MRGLMRRWRAKLCVLTLGGSMFGGVPFEACDEDVRVTMIEGLNGAANALATTLINAFFTSVNEDNNDLDNATTI